MGLKTDEVSESQCVKFSTSVTF